MVQWTAARRDLAAVFVRLRLANRRPNAQSQVLPPGWRLPCILLMRMRTPLRRLRLRTA